MIDLLKKLPKPLWVLIILDPAEEHLSMFSNMNLWWGVWNFPHYIFGCRGHLCQYRVYLLLHRGNRRPGEQCLRNLSPDAKKLGAIKHYYGGDLLLNPLFSILLLEFRDMCYIHQEKLIRGTEGASWTETEEWYKGFAAGIWYSVPGAFQMHV